VTFKITLNHFSVQLSATFAQCAVATNVTLLRAYGMPAN